MKVEIKEYLQSEITKLDRSIVETPDSMAELEAFAFANNGSNDVVLMHMAVKLGYKMALNAVEHKVNTIEIK